MDRGQDRHPLRWRALGLCNGLVRRILTARNSSFTWNVDHADLRYCEDSESTPSLYQSVPNTCDPFGNGSVRRLRDYASYSSIGLASMRERQLFSLHQEQLDVKPIEVITMMTLASFEKDKIMQAISALSGREVVSTNFRTTFLQYLQLCRTTGLQFRFPLSACHTQCLTCLKHEPVSIQRFRCDCIPFQFSYIQDCNCECGIGLICVCDDFPPMCYDLDVLANIVTAIWRQFLVYFIRTCQTFTDLVMSLHFIEEFYEVRARNVPATIRRSQFEPP